MQVKDRTKARKGKAHFRKLGNQISDQRLYLLANELETLRGS